MFYWIIDQFGNITEYWEDRSSGGLIFLLALPFFLIIAVAFIFSCIFGMWYYMFNAMTTNGAEGYIATGIIITSIIITTVIAFKNYEEYASSIVRFYITNSIITYVLINISSIFFGSFGLSSIIGGAFIVLCLSILPSVILPAIIKLIMYIKRSSNKKRKKTVSKSPSKLPAKSMDSIKKNVPTKDNNSSSNPTAYSRELYFKNDIFFANKN